MSHFLGDKSESDLRQESHDLSVEFLERADDAGILWVEYGEDVDRQAVLETDTSMRGMFERALAECLRDHT